MALNRCDNRFNIGEEVTSDFFQFLPQWRNGSAADL